MLVPGLIVQVIDDKNETRMSTFVCVLSIPDPVRASLVAKTSSTSTPSRLILLPVGKCAPVVLEDELLEIWLGCKFNLENALKLVAQRALAVLRRQFRAKEVDNYSTAMMSYNGRRGFKLQDIYNLHFAVAGGQSNRTYKELIAFHNQYFPLGFLPASQNHKRGIFRSLFLIADEICSSNVALPVSNYLADLSTDQDVFSSGSTEALLTADDLENDGGAFVYCSDGGSEDEEDGGNDGPWLNSSSTTSATPSPSDSPASDSRPRPESSSRSRKRTAYDLAFFNIQPPQLSQEALLEGPVELLVAKNFPVVRRFTSIKAAAYELEVTEQEIRDCCLGKTESGHNLYWNFFVTTPQVPCKFKIIFICLFIFSLWVSPLFLFILKKY